MAALNITYQVRRGTASAWSKHNPILKCGEPGYELDTGKLKIGNGTLAWNDLEYYGYQAGDNVSVEIHDEKFSLHDFGKAYYKYIPSTKSYVMSEPVFERTVVRRLEGDALFTIVGASQYTFDETTGMFTTSDYQSYTFDWEEDFNKIPNRLYIANESSLTEYRSYYEDFFMVIDAYKIDAVVKTEGKDGYYEKVEVSVDNPWKAGLLPRVVEENGELVLGWYEPNPAVGAGYELPIAGINTLGGVKSSKDENKVSVDTDGIMEINSVNLEKIVQSPNTRLVLRGGSASINI